MPRRNGTGPLGMGSLTRRGKGFCSGFQLRRYLKTKGWCRMENGRRRGYRYLFSFAALLTRRK